MAYANAPYASNIPHMSYTDSTPSSNMPASSAPSNPGPQTRHSSVPQHLVASASPMPSSTNFPIYQLGNQDFIQQPLLVQLVEGQSKFYQKLQESLKNEREIWHKREKELLDRIQELEDNMTSLMRNGGKVLSFSNTRPNIHGIPTHSAPERVPTTVSAPWVPPTTTSKDSSDSAVPYTSNSSEYTGDGEHSIHGIRRKSVNFSLASRSGNARTASEPAIPGERIHESLDGVNFKASAVLTGAKKATEEMNEEAVDEIPSPRSQVKNAPLPKIRPQLMDIPTANKHSEELYSRDAGHTPLARVTGSEDSSGGRTPVQADRPPLEPAPTQDVVRQPSERQDSYFKNAPIDAAHNGTTESPGDRVLKAPLGLSRDANATDEGFLKGVNRQLSQLIQAQGKGHKRDISRDLPINTKSTNFGTVYGSPYCAIPQTRKDGVDPDDAGKEDGAQNENDTQREDDAQKNMSDNQKGHETTSTQEDHAQKKDDDARSEDDQKGDEVKTEDGTN